MLICFVDFDFTFVLQQFELNSLKKVQIIKIYIIKINNNQFSLCIAFFQLVRINLNNLINYM